LSWLFPKAEAARRSTGFHNGTACSARKAATARKAEANLPPMIWLTSPDAIAPALPAAWLIATDQRPVHLPGRSNLRRETARRIIARQFALPEGAVEIGHDERGQPLLLGPVPPGLHLSLATRAGVVAIALAQRPTGIDVEQIDDATEPPLASLHPDERAALLKLPAAKRTAAFAQIWSAKEAYVKALGTGFARSPESFAVTLSAGQRFFLTDPVRKLRIEGDTRLIKNGGQESLAAAIIVLD
jgi:4'-phosphopantetheinyl transferase